MKIFTKEEIQPPEHINLDEGCLKNVIPMLVVPVSEPAGDQFPLTFGGGFGRRHFSLEQYCREEWVPVKRVGNIEQGFRRYFHWTSLKPVRATFRRPPQIRQIEEVIG